MEEKGLMDMDNSVVIARWKWGIRRLNDNGKNTIQKKGKKSQILKKIKNSQNLKNLKKNLKSQMNDGNLKWPLSQG